MFKHLYRIIGMYKYSKQIPKCGLLKSYMLEFHIIMAAIIFQTFTLLYMYVILCMQLWIAKYVANSLLDLKFTMTSNAYKILIDPHIGAVI